MSKCARIMADQMLASSWHVTTRQVAIVILPVDYPSFNVDQGTKLDVVMCRHCLKTFSPEEAGACNIDDCDGEAHDIQGPCYQAYITFLEVHYPDSRTSSIYVKTVSEEEGLTVLEAKCRAIIEGDPQRNIPGKI